MNQDSFSFVIYMLHACADKWGMLPSEVYRKLQNVDCISQYLAPHYEILHTQGTGYVIEDIKEYLAIRGVKI